jgi:hypothetical protein
VLPLHHESHIFKYYQNYNSFLKLLLLFIWNSNIFQIFDFLLWQFY